MKDTPKTESELLGRLVDLFEDVAPSTQEEIEAELVAAGIDPEEIRRGTDSFIAEVTKASPYDWRNRAPRERAAAAVSLVPPTIPSKADRVGVVAEIRQILQRVPGLGVAPMVQVHCRNFEKSTDEDLSSLLADLRFLETLQRGPGAKE